MNERKTRRESMRVWLPPAVVAAALLGVGLYVRQSAGPTVFAQEPSQGNQAPQRDKPNRLANQISPYLLQHAYNPVDWYPWGEEAFEAARSQERPIFLSIGYSTCHWCHVMERESFSDGEIAAYLNRHFVSIKVDREERPDVDRVYMSFVQASTGGGGWPMSVFLTPQLKPFFGGTYFPPPRFRALLEKVAEEWNQNRGTIVAAADRITGALREMQKLSDEERVAPAKAMLDKAYQFYASVFDSKQGGFGQAPKFPRPSNLNFLLRYSARSGQKKALEMSAATLRAMARGGIHDHVGGGFHRYSTDERWFLPHFEKMLYDQAQLASVYLEAHQITGEALFGEVARAILEYVLREMTGPEGGFYSAQDADSSVSAQKPDEHAEGAFYVWTLGEIVDLLGERAAAFSRYYGVREAGNVEKDPFSEFRGKNVLSVVASLEETALGLEMGPLTLNKQLEESRARLLERRSRRPRPLLDDKVLTSWNGLMISAFAKGYQVLGEARYLEAAGSAAALVADKLHDPATGLLKRRYRKGEAAIRGMASDYAFYVQGLIDLYESSLESRWLDMALKLTEKAMTLFWDEKEGGFYNTTGEDPSILVRHKEDYDGAEPSANSIMTLNLLRLSQVSGNTEWSRGAARTLEAFSQRLTQAPQALPQMMVAVDYQLHKPRQILIAGEAGRPDTRRILAEVHKRFLPAKIVFLADGGPVHTRLAAQLEILKSLSRRDGKATAYICEDYVCRLPTNDPAVVGRLLDEE